MLEQCKSAKERWGGVNDMIDRWLNERQELITAYFHISGLSPYQGNGRKPINEKLGEFCQVLVDYVSAAHFEIYEQLLLEAKEFKDGGTELAERLYPKLAGSTQSALDFNDKYTSEVNCLAVVDDLPADLSGLGEGLEERFQMEDLLIESLHNAHRGVVA